MLKDAGAASIITAVAIDKLHPDALTHADHAMFQGVADFIVGYGMDDAGNDRGLPLIGRLP